MPRLIYLKDWGYNDFSYYEVGDEGASDSLGVEIELEDDSGIESPGVFFLKLQRRRMERAQVAYLVLLLSLPLLSFTVFHINYQTSYTQEMAPLAMTEINPFSWWYWGR